MNLLCKCYLLVSMVILSIPFSGFSQDTISRDSSDVKLIKAAREIMISAGNCALITLDDAGRPRARSMDAFIPESDLTVWFGTTVKSRKVNQIRNDPRVSLYYFDSDASGYVMIQGIAQLVDDPDEKEKRWKTKWEAFYPNKSEDYILIKVSPEWMEVVSYAHGIVSEKATWEPPLVVF
ncbi:MAG: pyridoxamine 5'-phosphate oxidase family protein [Bacteroidota bacterium]|nr:pyridoxamine 5'-phosphate oxidase family protein [Bacteroidota bacterium]